MAALGFALFETKIGACGIAWRADENAHRIVLVQLPEDDATATRARVRRRVPGAEEMAPPSSVQAITQRIAAMIAGAKDDLADVPLDMGELPEFDRRVFEVARTIPPGKTRSYGDLAFMIGERQPESAQRVGQALGRNPFAPVVPCHRVLAANGHMNGFSAYGGIATKRKMLVTEGAIPEEPDLFGGA